MERALEAAKAVRGATSPNPCVGAVIVREGRVLEVGATEPPGGRHAEAVAIAGCPDARGADVYVTLEPCARFEGKRTPACSEALIAAGVARVVVALEDADTNVAGRGIAALRAAGVTVEVGDGAEETRDLLRPYIKHRRTGTPWVIAKWAQSLDGRLGAPGVRWLTSAGARERTHADRAWVDAILVGVGTVLADDPALTARPGGELAGHQPMRIVVDSRGGTPVGAAVLGAGGATVIACARAASAAWRREMAAAGAQVLELEDGPDGLDMEQLLAVLGQRGVLSLLVEGGAKVLGSFLGSGLADEVQAYIAPIVLGERGQALAPRLDGPIALSGVTIESLHPDVLVRGYTAP